MSDLSSENILHLNQTQYESYFLESDFGIDLATKLVTDLGYTLPLTRKTEGASLVFTLGDEYFLKITPPFMGDSFEAEISATQTIGDQLPFSIPKIIKTGLIKDWKFVITQTVPGQQAKNVLRSFNQLEMIEFAGEIGLVIKAIHQVETNGFERSFGPWNVYLSNRIQNASTIHLEKGASPEWADKISVFINKYKNSLKELKGEKLIHADLNHEHLMLGKVGGEWKICGVIDFADAMNAPVELEFILPILCFFKGKVEHQRKLWEKSEIIPRFKPEDYSNMMMALALQNRFIEFEDWFSREIKSGATTVEEIATIVFPQLI